jgi:hypothetical protein
MPAIPTSNKVLSMIQAPPRPPVAPPPPRPPHRINASGRQFLVVNGRRVWLETPPADVLPDLLRTIR